MTAARACRAPLRILADARWSLPLATGRPLAIEGHAIESHADRCRARHREHLRHGHLRHASLRHASLRHRQLASRSRVALGSMARPMKPRGKAWVDLRVLAPRRASPDASDVAAVATRVLLLRPPTVLDRRRQCPTLLESAKRLRRAVPKRRSTLRRAMPGSDHEPNRER